MIQKFVVATLFSFILVSCEWMRIPQEPFIVKEVEIRDNKFYVKCISIKYPKRANIEFYSTTNYRVGDTVTIK